MSGGPFLDLNVARATAMIRNGWQADIGSVGDLVVLPGDLWAIDGAAEW